MDLVWGKREEERLGRRKAIAQSSLEDISFSCVCMRERREFRVFDFFGGEEKLRLSFVLCFDLSGFKHGHDMR